MTARLYLISPPAIDLPAFAQQLKDAFNGGDVACFQLRLKNAGDEEILKAAGALIPICHAHGAAFILNDRPDLAAKCGADGVHLGQDDLLAFPSPFQGEGQGEGAAQSAAAWLRQATPSPDFSKACKSASLRKISLSPKGARGKSKTPIPALREIIGPDKVIGVSCHDSRHLAMLAGEQGADYVAFGAFYPTKSKSPENLARYGIPSPGILAWWQETMVLPCVAIGGITPQNCLPLVKAGADFIAAITSVWEHPEGPGKAVREFNQVMRGS